MIYTQEVLDYIVATKEEIGSYSYIAKKLKLPHDVVMSLYQYQKGLENGTLVITRNPNNIDPNENTITLEMLKKGWYSTRLRNNGNELFSNKMQVEPKEGTECSYDPLKFISTKSINSTGNAADGNSSPSVKSVHGVSKGKAEEIVRLYTQEAASSNDIVKLTKVQSYKVKDVLEANNIPMRYISRTVKRETVEEIKRRVLAGGDKIALAYEFGCTPAQIDKMLNPTPSGQKSMKKNEGESNNQAIPPSEVKSKDQHIKQLTLENESLRQKLSNYEGLFLQIFDAVSDTIPTLIKTSSLLGKKDIDLVGTIKQLDTLKTFNVKGAETCEN